MMFCFGFGGIGEKLPFTNSGREKKMKEFCFLDHPVLKCFLSCMRVLVDSLHL